MYKKIYFALICWLVHLIAQGQSPTQVKVLFIGNSYTSRANIPALTSSIGSAMGVEIIPTVSAAEGANLKDHWNGKRGFKTKSLIANGGYDLVIIQDQSMRPIQRPFDTIEDIQRFYKFVKQHNVRLGLFMTWAKQHSANTQIQLDKTYSEGAEATNAILFPVGAAWLLAKATNPKIKLYDADGSHPSVYGGYLAALVFVEIITREFKLQSTRNIAETNILNLPGQENQFYINISRKASTSTKYEGN